MRLDERIPNLTSELKSDDIYCSLWPKNGRKLAKYPILPVSDRFLTKMGQMLSNFNSETRFGIISSSLDPKTKGLLILHILTPHRNFKTLVGRSRVGMKILKK